ncbi:hypothetical protein Hte_006448 [Hypoxylon texense]
MAKGISIIKLLFQPGFHFSGRQFCEGKTDNNTSYKTTRRVYAALCGGNPKQDDRSLLRESVKAAVMQLLLLCRQREQLFRSGVVDLDTVLQTVISEWKPQSDLRPSDVRLIIESYVKARDNFLKSSTASEESELASRVDEFKDTWRVMSEQKGKAATAEAALSRPWPPADFAPVEQRMFTEFELRYNLQGVDNEHQGYTTPSEAGDEPLQIQEFLSLLALSHFPKTHRFALYPRPVGYKDYAAKHRARNDEFGTVSEFVHYAHDMLLHHDRDMAIGFAMFAARTRPKAFAIQKIGEDAGAGFRLVCFDPTDDDWDTLMSHTIKKLQNVFGNAIKEAWWGGWSVYSVNNYSDTTEWVLTWIQNVVFDDIWLPQTYRMESDGYGDISDMFTSISELPFRPAVQDS